jgi:hypothetical protein
MPAEFTIQPAKYHQPIVFISFNFMALFLLKVLLQGGQVKQALTLSIGIRTSEKANVTVFALASSKN